MLITEGEHVCTDTLHCKLKQSQTHKPSSTRITVSRKPELKVPLIFRMHSNPSSNAIITNLLARAMTDGSCKASGKEAGHGSGMWHAPQARQGNA